MAVIDSEAIFHVSPKASIQALGDGAVVLLVDSGQLYTCNEPTEAMLKLVNGQRKLGEIIDLALQEFEIDRATLEHDFLSIAADLVKEGILIT
jgi:hypothetical protein